MTIKFSGSELLEIAIQIEKNGHAFYTGVAGKVSDPEARKVIEWLALEEKNHINKFNDILSNFDGNNVDMTPEELQEYSLYIKALADSRVFTSELDARKAASEIKNWKDAVDIAIGFEKDTLLFLHGMRPLVKGGDVKALEELQREEMSHLRRLAEIKGS